MAGQVARRIAAGRRPLKALGAPLEALVVRKLGVPGHEELAFGAIASGGVRVLNDEVVGEFRDLAGDDRRVAADEQRELERRERLYRPSGAVPAVDQRAAIVVDDGLATGATMRAAVAALRSLGAGRVITAVPVGAPETCARLRELADEMMCPLEPEPLLAIGVWYERFEQETDAHIRELLGVRRSADVVDTPGR